MVSKPKASRPSFFKVLIGDYSSRLRLPHVFVQKYGEFLPESAKLRTSSGETWGVKLKEETYDDEDEKYWCINGGWSKFVKDLGLKLGEFIVFWFYIGESTFDVSVYGTHGCEREIPAMDVESDADGEDSELMNDCCNVPDVRKKRSRSFINPESEDAGTNTETHPRFEKLLSETRKFRPPMDRNSNAGASFFKLLVDDDFTSKLRIPTKFVNKHGEILRPKMTLRIDSLSGKLWMVGTEQVGQLHFFTKGWSKFAEDVDLKHREFLIFEFVGRSTFLVSVYEITGCKKNYSNSGETGNSLLKVKIEDNQEIDSNAVTRTWRFSKELKKHHFMTPRMDIPKDFAVGTGITTNRRIKLQDAKGRKWPVTVTVRDLRMYAMTAGFKNFLIGNKVGIGSIISFEFIPGSDNIVEALVIKNGTLKEHSVLAERGKRRPPLRHRS